MSDTSPEIAAYRLAVVACLRRAGYAASSALAMARNYRTHINGSFDMGLPASACAVEILWAEEEDIADPNRTPILGCAPVVDSGTLAAIEGLMEEGR